MTFFTELRRRNVIKVASVYLVTCWLIIQVVAVIAPALHIPTVFATMVTIVLMIGFPFACIFAWAFELTPQGLKLTGEVDANESISNQTGSAINKALVGALVLAVGFIAVDKLYLESVADDKAHSIAVLPFEDMSPDRSQEYFGDGIAEEILNSLARTNAMTVISRTSSFRYKGSEHDIRKIGAELNVNYVLEGSVRKDKDQLRITAQLIEVESGAHIWSQTYDRELTSIFAVQDELTYAITQALQLNLLPDDMSTTVGMTNNPEAYELFVEARELSYQRNSNTTREAIDLFDQALAIDPDFHLARAQLYATYMIAYEYGGIQAEEIEEKATQLFWQLQAAPDFPLKWLVISQQAQIENKVNTYLRLITKAYEAAPNDPLIQNVYLLNVQDIDTSISEREHVLKTNPASEINRVNLHELYLVNKQFDRASALRKDSKRVFGETLNVLWMDVQYLYAAKRDIQATINTIKGFSGETSSSIRALEVSSLLYGNQIDAALATLDGYLQEYPEDIDLYMYSYASLLHLKQKGVLNESQAVVFEKLPIPAETRELGGIFYQLLLGNPLPYEHKYNPANLTREQQTELVNRNTLSLYYLAIKKRQGNESAWMTAVIPNILSYNAVCKNNVVNATASWCEIYFYLTDQTDSSERLVDQSDAVEYWNHYDSGKEAFLLTSPAYYAMHDSSDSNAQLQALLSTSIERTNPEIITRKGLD